MSKKIKAHWVYRIQYKPSYSSVYVFAKCSNCGEKWTSVDTCVGNPEHVFGAMWTNGTREQRIRHTKAMTEEYLLTAEKNPMDKFCRNCGAEMSILDKDGMMDWED